MDQVSPESVALTASEHIDYVVRATNFMNERRRAKIYLPERIDSKEKFLTLLADLTRIGTDLVYMRFGFSTGNSTGNSTKFLEQPEVTDQTIAEGWDIFTVSKVMNT